MKDPQSGPNIEVSQESAIEELEEIPDTRYRNLLGQINWLQSRTQFQCCYKFYRCASKAASPTIGDVKALNKLARQLKSQLVKLQFWPLTGPLRIIGFPVAPNRNNEDGIHRQASQWFKQDCESILEEWNVIRKSCRLRKSEDQKDCALNNCGRIVFFHEMFWFMPVPPWTVDGLIR